MKHDRCHRSSEVAGSRGRASATRPNESPNAKAVRRPDIDSIESIDVNVIYIHLRQINGSVCDGLGFHVVVATGTHHFGRADRERADRIPASSAVRRERADVRLGSRHQNGPHWEESGSRSRHRVRGNWWVNHQAAIVLSTTIALRRCSVSKTSNASSRNS